MNKHTVVALVVVTVLVSAVWMPAYAQQNKTTTSQQAAMLLEIQALRSEIAELRDMVDRQNTMYSVFAVGLVPVFHTLRCLSRTCFGARPMSSSELVKPKMFTRL